MAVRNPGKRLIEAAMTLAAAKPWPEIAYREIAAQAGVPLAEAWTAAPGRQAILAHLSHLADREVLKEPAALEDGCARDRMFDVLMRRFDALRPYRCGLASVARGLANDPGAALASGRSLCCSMEAMLVAAGVSAEGCAGFLKTKGLVGVWLGTFRTFLKDESEDLAPTMAALDRQLRRAERIMGWFGRRRKAPGPAEKPPEGEPA